MRFFKRSPFIAARYIAYEFSKWFALSVAFFFAAFFINNVLLLAQDILSQRAPLFKVLTLLFYTFPTILSYTFPFSVLLATVVVMVQYNAHHELLAMQAAGISRPLCYLPIMLFSLLLTAVSFFINDYLLPRSAVQFIQLYQEILFSTPGLELKPYSIRRYEDNIIVTQDVNEDRLYNPLIIQSNADNNQRRIITGNSAQIHVQEQQGILTLELVQVQGHSHDSDVFSEYEYFFADALSYNVLLFALNIALRPPTAREMNTAMVKEYLDTERADVLSAQVSKQQEVNGNTLLLSYLYLDQAYRVVGDRRTAADKSTLNSQYNIILTQADEHFFDQEYRIYETEYYRKFSLPTACFFLTLFAFPVGVRLKRANWSIGFGIGLIASVVFWCLLIGGQIISIQRENLSPVLIMFLPNIVMVASGAIIPMVTRRRR